MPNPASGQPSAIEQLSLELLNRARLDPAGEFDALIVDAATRTGVTQDITIALNDQTRIGNTIHTGFDVDMTMLRNQFDALVPVAPLAWNAALAAGAGQHNAWMIAADLQSHRLQGEAGLGDRLTAAGYANYSRVSENIFAYVQDAVHAHAGFFIDWGYGPGGMQSPPGHRDTIMNGALSEVGIAFTAEGNPATAVGPLVVTQDFGARTDYAAQLLGVVIDDRDGNDFYGIGEGMAGVTVTATGVAGSFSTSTWDSGGYQMELPDGDYRVVFSGGGLTADVTRDVNIAGANVRLAIEAADAADAADAGGAGGTRDYSDATGRVIADLGQDLRGQPFLRFFTDGAAAGDTYDGIGNLIGGAWADSLRGDAEANVLQGGARSDRLYGRGGDDTLDGGAGADALYGNRGADVMTGGPGAGVRDRFIFFNADESRPGAGNRDIITDFVSGEDRIELGRLDADTTLPRNQAFDFIGEAAFSAAGQLRYAQHDSAGGGFTLIEADMDGDGLADFEIELSGMMTLAADDFLL